jgi:uncharacterized membrane protein
MNDRIRISDTDRDRAASRLRDHYAEGRLTAEELDERVTAALNARTAGDLRKVMADLPSSGPSQPGPNLPPFAGAPWAYRRRGPRLLPLALFILFALLLLPGGGLVLFGILKLLLLLWLLVALVGVVAAFRFRHRVRRAFRDRGVPLQWHGWDAWRDGRD